MKLGKRKHLEEMPDEERQTYQPGGHGIHRRREDDDDEPMKKRKYGEEYKSKVRFLLLYS